MAEVTGRVLARNSVFAFAAQMWRIGSRFILTPIILLAVGVEGYGTWTLMFSICAYVNVIDTNFGVAYTKFTAEYDAKRDYERLATIIGSGMVLIGSIGAVAIAALWMLRREILHALNVTEPLMDDAAKALLLVSSAVFMRMSVGCVFQILTGLQRLDLRHKLAILASATEFVVAIILLYRGWGLVGLATGHVTGQVLTIILAWWFCHRLAPQLKISPFNFSWDGLRQMFSLGGRFQLLSFMQMLIQHGTKLVISALLGVEMLAIAEIANKLMSLGMAVGGTVIAPLLPAFSNFHASGSRDRAQNLYEHGSRISAIVSLPTFAFLAIFANRLVPLWTGHDFPLSIWTVQVMAPVAFLSMLTGMGTASLRGRGSIRLEMSYALVGIAVLIALYPPGYYFGHYQGMIMAEVIAGIAGAFWFFFAFARSESLNAWAWLRATLVRPLVILGPVIAIIAGLATTFTLDFGIHGRRMALVARMGVWGLAYTVAVLVVIWFALLTEEDRASVKSYLPGRRHATEPEKLPTPAGLEPTAEETAETLAQ